MTRYRFVDLLRGIAAIAVLICHYRWFFARYPGDWRTDVSLPGYSILWPIYDHGEVAVWLFWTLSGFVFALAYGGRTMTIPEFWWRRFSRLYPLHFATLLIAAGLQACSLAHFGVWQVYGNNDLPHFALQLFLASNWFTMDNSYNGPIWSVSIEELIYFVFMAYMVWANRKWAIVLALIGMGLERVTHSPVALCLGLFFVGVIFADVRPGLRLSLSLVIAGLILTSLTGVMGIIAYVVCPALLCVAIALDERFELPRQFNWIGLSTYSIY